MLQLLKNATPQPTTPLSRTLPARCIMVVSAFPFIVTPIFMSTCFRKLSGHACQQRHGEGKPSWCFIGAIPLMPKQTRLAVHHVGKLLFAQGSELLNPGSCTLFHQSSPFDRTQLSTMGCHPRLRPQILLLTIMPKASMSHLLVTSASWVSFPWNWRISL